MFITSTITQMSGNHHIHAFHALLYFIMENQKKILIVCKDYIYSSFSSNKAFLFCYNKNFLWILNQYLIKIEKNASSVF